MYGATRPMAAVYWRRAPKDHEPATVGIGRNGDEPDTGLSRTVRNVSSASSTLISRS
jgi:hypothetical protein